LLSKFHRVLEHGQCFFQVDDVNFVAMAKNKRGHFGIPKACLMTEVDTGFQHFAHRCRHKKLQRLSLSQFFIATADEKAGQHLVGTGLGFAYRKGPCNSKATTILSHPLDVGSK
jgi:hypothetical protein